MFALIFDKHRLNHPRKKVISVHRSRQEAEEALENRREALGRRIWECHTRIVWTEKKISAGDFVGPGDYDNWRPGEKIPYGELYSDAD